MTLMETGSSVLASIRRGKGESEHGISPLLWCLSLLVSVAVGCGESGRYRVSGNVTFDGAPVPAGTLTFIPIGPGDPGRSAGFCRITSGKFTSRTGRHPAGGLHRVMINGFDGVPFTSEVADQTVTNPFGKPLFDMHFVEVDVPKKQDTVLDFVVPSIGRPAK